LVAVKLDRGAGGNPNYPSPAIKLVLRGRKARLPLLDNPAMRWLVVFEVVAVMDVSSRLSHLRGELAVSRYLSLLLGTLPLCLAQEPLGLTLCLPFKPPQISLNHEHR